MIRCPVCQTENSEQTACCVHCGQPLTPLRPYFSPCAAQEGPPFGQTRQNGGFVAWSIVNMVLGVASTISLVLGIVGLMNALELRKSPTPESYAATRRTVIICNSIASGLLALAIMVIVFIFAMMFNGMGPFA